MRELPVDPAALRDAARIIKAIAHPVRLCIVTGLVRTGGCAVNEMQDCLGMPQAVVSQHLARLRAAGVVAGLRRGNRVIYEIRSELARRVAAAVLDFHG